MTSEFTHDDRSITAQDRLDAATERIHDLEMQVSDLKALNKKLCEPSAEDRRAQQIIRDAAKLIGWQDVSTAPMDGRRILVFGKDEETHPGDHGWAAIATFFDDIWLTDAEYMFYPTHWQPLPEPPKP